MSFQDMNKIITKEEEEEGEEGIGGFKIPKFLKKPMMLYVHGSILDKKDITLFVDTGAQFSAMGKSLAEELDIFKDVKSDSFFSSKKRFFVGVGGRSPNIYGKVENVNIQFLNKENNNETFHIKHSFTVMDDSTSMLPPGKCILGIDFLRENDCILDLCDESFEMRFLCLGKSVPFLKGNQIPFPKLKKEMIKKFMEQQQKSSSSEGETNSGSNLLMDSMKEMMKNQDLQKQFSKMMNFSSNNPNRKKKKQTQKKRRGKKVLSKENKIKAMVRMGVSRITATRILEKNGYDFEASVYTVLEK